MRDEAEAWEIKQELDCSRLSGSSEPVLGAPSAIKRTSAVHTFLPWSCFQKCVLEILVLSDASPEK